VKSARAVNNMFNDAGLRDKKFIWIPVFIWMGVIFLFAVLPCKNVPLAKVSHFDSVAHFAEYAILAGLVLRSFSLAGKILNIKIGLFTLILAGGYGILLELVQCFVPERCASVSDIIFNFAGVVFGITVGKFVLWRK